MQKISELEFYYQAAAYKDKTLANNVYRILENLIQITDYNLFVCRYLIASPQLFCIVVVGEEPWKILDETIYKQLKSTGEMIGIPPDVLRDLLRRATMN